MIKYFLFVVLGTCLLVNDVCSQDQKVIDSLNALLTGKTGGERFPVLYELTFQYIQKDNEKALEFIQDAEKAAVLSGESLSILKSKRVKGQIFYLLQRADEARKTFEEALPVTGGTDFRKEELQIYYTLAKLDLFQGKYDKALHLFFKSLELAKALRDTQHLALTLHSIGITYYKLKDYAKSLNYYQRSLQAHKFDPRESFFFLTNLGLCYAHLGDFSNARYFVGKSLRDCGPDCSEKGRINIEYAYGVIALGERNFNAAEENFLRSYSLARKTNNTRFLLDNIYLLSEIYIQQKQFNKAKLYLLEAEELIRTNIPFNLEVIKIYYRFSEFYLEIQEYKEASLYQSKYIDLKDSIYNEDLTNSLMKIEAEHLEHQNQAKIEAQEDVILLKEEIIRRQRTLNVITALLAAVVLMFSIVVFRNYKQKQNLNLLLEKKIKERTFELEVGRDALQKALHEKDLRISRASGRIVKSMNTITGLCAAGNLEISDPVARLYMSKLTNTFVQMASYFRSLTDEELHHLQY
ncbi:MAG: tetratricopeptide repeat protein [Cyclobacteriaceae bacterium]